MHFYCETEEAKRVFEMPREEFNNVTKEMRRVRRMVAHFMNFGIEDLSEAEIDAVKNALAKSKVIKDGYIENIEMVYILDAIIVRQIKERRDNDRHHLFG